MPHVGPWRLIHKRRVAPVRLGESDLVWDVGVYSLHGCSFGRKWRIVLFNHLLLHADPALFLIALLVTDHLQILDLGLWRWRQSFLHPLLRVLIAHIQLISLVLILDNVCLAHWQLWNGRLHLAVEITQSALEFVDPFRHLECGLSALNSILLELLRQVGHFIQDEFLLE